MLRLDAESRDVAATIRIGTVQQRVAAGEASLCVTVRAPEAVSGGRGGPIVVGKGTTQPICFMVVLDRCDGVPQGLARDRLRQW